MKKFLTLNLLSLLMFSSVAMAADNTQVSKNEVLKQLQHSADAQELALTEAVKLKNKKEEQEKICREYFNSDSFVRLKREQAVSYVVSNFTKAVYSYYCDQLAIRENLQKAYSFVLSATPAIEKLNAIAFGRVQDKTFHYQKANVIEIKTVDESNMIYEAHLQVVGKDLKELSDFVDFEHMTPKDFFVKLTLIHVPNINKNTNIVENSGIISVNPKMAANPFNLWVKDFEIVANKKQDH